MEPTLVPLSAFHVVGLQGTFSAATRTQIPALWERFVARMEEIEGRKDEDVSYGLCTPCVPGPDGTEEFTYTAAVEVEALDAVPDGFVGFTVPAQTYARFTHTGHISDIDKTIDAIWGTALRANLLQPTGGIEFERYDDRWDGATGTGPVDIYVPVKSGGPRR